MGGFGLSRGIKKGKKSSSSQMVWGILVIRNHTCKILYPDSYEGYVRVAFLYSFAFGHSSSLTLKTENWTNKNKWKKKKIRLRTELPLVLEPVFQATFQPWTSCSVCPGYPTLPINSSLSLCFPSSSFSQDLLCVSILPVETGFGISLIEPMYLELIFVFFIN